MPLTSKEKEVLLNNISGYLESITNNQQEPEGISIVIPTYEQKGYGPRLLNELLKSISIQTITVPYEVVISDSSKDELIKSICDKYSFVKYNTSTSTNACDNINNSINLASYSKVKIMCQDDIFLTKNAIDLFCRSLDNTDWVISNSISINEHSHHIKKHAARYVHNFFRKNLVGMPSVVAFKKNSIRLNNNLGTCVDMYFYHQLYEFFGSPGYITDYTIGQRYHNASLSRNQENTHDKDVQWLISEGLMLK